TGLSSLTWLAYGACTVTQAPTRTNTTATSLSTSMDMSVTTIGPGGEDTSMTTVKDRPTGSGMATPGSLKARSAAAVPVHGTSRACSSSTATRQPSGCSALGQSAVVATGCRSGA